MEIFPSSGSEPGNFLSSGQNLEIFPSSEIFFWVVPSSRLNIFLGKMETLGGGGAIPPAPPD